MVKLGVASLRGSNFILKVKYRTIKEEIVKLENVILFVEIQTQMREERSRYHL